MMLLKPPASVHRGAGAQHHRHPTGFTLHELLVTLGLIAILTAIALPLISKARSAEKAVTCVANLRQLALGFRMYAHDNNGRLPDPTNFGIPWEQAVRKYADARELFSCPADDEIFPALGSSYDWRDTPDPLTSMAGRSVEQLTRADAVLVFEALPGWHERARINVARLDGSAAGMDQNDYFQDMDKPIVASP